MGAEEKGEIALPKLAVIIVEVEDLDKAMEYYSSFGIGPFLVQERTNDAVLHGRKTRFTARWALAPLGPVLLELAQTIQGEHVHSEFLKERGEGVSSLVFQVDDLDAEIAKFERRGIEVLMRVKRESGGGFAFMDTAKTGGVMFELLEGELSGLEDVEWGHTFQTSQRRVPKA